MNRSNLMGGLMLATVLLAGTAAAQQQRQSGDSEAREPQPAEHMPLAGQTTLNDVHRAGKRYVAVGARGHILLSDDGEQWQQVDSPTRAMLTRVEFHDDDIGWAVGWDGAILRTTDGGQSWSLVNFEPDWGKPYFDVMPTGPDAALIVGSNGRAMRTDDAGESWQRLENDVFATGFNLYEIDQVGDEALVIAGERGMIARSLDSGESWSMLVPPYIGSYFGVIATGDYGAVLFGLQGRVLHASDVRELPTLDDPMAYDPFSAESITDPDRLAEMGWRRISNPGDDSLFGGHVYDGERLVLVGVDGVVLQGSLSDGELKLLDGPTAAPLSDVIADRSPWLLTGRTGLHHMQPPD